MSISNYASTLQYRASGALKHLDYGNAKTLDMNYDARLQPVSFTIPGVMSKSYDYAADGRLSFSHDLINSHFDRSYSYDHAGRITEALSGAEARNEGTTNVRPYKEAFSYDALGHLEERPVNNVWSGGGGSFSPSHQTYQNERNTAWQYDADGNLTDSVNVQYTIDAAGQANRVVSLTMLPYNPDSTIWGVTNDLSRSLDGDGAVVKQVDAETTHDPANGDETTTNTTYLVRSSVLGGKVLTEISSETGQRGFVYLGNEVLAQQLKVGTTESVKWEHRDAGNASFRMTLSNGTLDTSERAELDPLGTNAGLSDPNTPPSLKKLSLYPGFGASQMSSDTQCMLDGMVTPCSTVVRTMSVGAAAQESWTHDRQGWHHQQYPIEPLGLSVFSVWEPDPDNPRGKTGPHPVDDVDVVGVNISQDDLLGHYNYFSLPQNTGGSYEACKNLASIPESVANDILSVSRQERTDPTLLAVTWSNESSFSYNPPPFPRWREGRIVGYDVGLMGIATNIWNKSPYTDGLSNPFGTEIGAAQFGKRAAFSGNASDNLRLGARALNASSGWPGRPPNVSPRADAAGIFREGSRKGDYWTRVSKFNKSFRAYDRFFNCMQGKSY